MRWDEIAPHCADPASFCAPQEAWLSGGSLQTAFQTNHSTKLGPGEGSKAKRRALMLHSDPSILGKFGGAAMKEASYSYGAGPWGELKPSFSPASGYSLHGPSGEIESVDDY